MPNRNCTHSHDEQFAEVRASLAALAKQQTHALRLLKEMKKMNQESLALLQRLDAATTAIAARIQALLDNPSTTEAEFRAALEPEVARLEGMATDPANPVPTT